MSPSTAWHQSNQLNLYSQKQNTTPDASGNNPVFANKPHSGYYSIKCDNFYHPEADGGISILDDSLGIDWKIPTEHANLSEKDTKHKMLKDFDSPFDINVDLY